MAEFTLPTKLSDLLELAVTDARKCEAEPERFVLDMDDWMRPRRDRCAVCMAGAVMAQSLGFDASSKERIDPAKINNDSLKNAMWAIDSMREGAYWDAAEQMQISVAGGQEAAIRECDVIVQSEIQFDDDDDDERIGRAPWETYLKCVAILREVGL